ncbi:unnamed protein product [Closterium sp. Yama58-4]|nr:unnamed protein product [Closterium sp. Yama58-4]
MSPIPALSHPPLRTAQSFTATQKELVRAFTRSLNPNSDTSITVPLWWNINQLYYDRNGRFISSSVTIADETSDTAYSRGSSLSDSEIDSLVSSAITSQKLSYDQNGVYFVLSDETVSQSSQGSAFCTHYCGWHTYTDVSGKGRVVSGWVGNAKSLCPRSCIAGLISSSSSSPNRDKGMDGLLSVYAHELAEATSSPYLQTWMDDKGDENADKCGWKFGTGIGYHWDDLDPDQMAFCGASPAHCGVMHAPVGVYLLWYGAKFSEEQKDIVRLFIASLTADASNPDATAWWAINTLYFDQQGRKISSNVTIKGETHNTKYTRGTMLLRSDVEGLVQSAVGKGLLPYDPDGVYFVLSDEDVSQMDDQSGTGSTQYALAVCSHYCGWHSFTQGEDGRPLIMSFVGMRSRSARTTADGTPSPKEKTGDRSSCHLWGTQYALAVCSHYCGWHSFTQGEDGRPLIMSFVGNAVNQCPEGCIPPYLNQPGEVAPNGDAGMDGMVSVLAHELAEATSSPFLATWFDDQGEENADICSSSYGDVISDAATGVQ